RGVFRHDPAVVANGHEHAKPKVLPCAHLATSAVNLATPRVLCQGSPVGSNEEPVLRLRRRDGPPRLPGDEPRGRGPEPPWSQRGAEWPCGPCRRRGLT